MDNPQSPDSGLNILPFLLVANSCAKEIEVNKTLRNKIEFFIVKSIIMNRKVRLIFCIQNKNHWRLNFSREHFGLHRLLNKKRVPEDTLLNIH